MAATSTFARAYLRRAYALAQAEGLTLLAKLTEAATAATAAIASGQTIVATSGNGRSVTFSGGSGSQSEGITPQDIAELGERLLTLHDAAILAGKTTDALRFAWMMERLLPIRSVSTEFGHPIAR